MRASRILQGLAALTAAAIGGSAWAQCGPGNGDCCVPNGTPGCDDAACCAAVCAFDPFCCDTEWDSICVGQVASNCGPTFCPPPPACGPGAGDCYSANGTPGCECGPCCAIVCSLDPFCCNVEWDGFCAGSAGIECVPDPCAPPPTCGDPSTGDCFTANGTPFCDCAPCCATVCAVDAFCCTTSWDGICAAEAIDLCDPTLTLVVDDTCLDGDDVLTVSLVLQTCKPAAGFQAFIEFSDAALSFVGGSYTPSPFGLPVLDPIVASLGEINLAAGIDQFNGQVPFAGSDPVVLATLQFELNADDCFGTTIDFRNFILPTRLTALGGAEIPDLGLTDSDPVVVDGTNPFWTSPLPIDETVPADAGGCTAEVSIPAPTADDNCGSASVSVVRSDGEPIDAPFPQGVTTVTWTATDPCGNSFSHAHTIEVLAVNELVVSVALQGAVVPGPFTRCIEFVVSGCPGSATVTADVTFVGGVGSATIAVPCADGPYDCIVARDALHTLRSTEAVTVSGSQYEASFAGPTALRGGNADGNEYVDILDFGVFALQYGSLVGAGTPCPTPAPHADFNGDGFVDLLDFSFIQVNFLQFDVDSCACPLPLELAARPIERIAVSRLHLMGRGELAKADLNFDGWLDVQDIVAFLGGATP